MRITDLSLRRPVAVVVLSVAALALGFFALMRLDVDYLPDVTYPLVRMHVYWRGATPEEIETNIAEPVERAMAAVDDLDYLESSSIEGMYTLLVNFRYGVDVDVAYQDVLAVMGRVNRQLPPDVDPPYIFKADPSQLPVMEITVTSERHSLVWLRQWADNWLVDRLSSAQGTAGAEVVGGLEREIRVELDPLRMTAYNVSAERIAAALSSGNSQMFAGRVTVGPREIIARTMGEFANLDEIRKTVIARGPGGEPVYVGDVASVEDSHEEVRVITRFNGRPCVKVSVLKQAEANTVRVADAVRAKLDELRAEVPQGVEFGVMENQGDYVLGAVRSVRDSALLAAVLVILVVYAFLGHWRQVAVMFVALPLTLLANFFLMGVMGFSLNIFSLGGLVVALGVILDNSIVVLENITRHKQEAERDGRPLDQNLAVRATGEVGTAIVASTLTFMGIFLPFLIVPGLAALLFRELVLVVASVVVLSLLVAVTVTPFLADRLVVRAPTVRASGPSGRFDSAVGRMISGYQVLLDRALRARWLVLVLFVALFALGLYWGRSAGSEFLPQVDDGRVMVKLRMPAGTSVGESDRILAKVERQLEGLPDIESMFTIAGGRVQGLATYEIAQEGEVDVQLVPRSRRDVSTADFVQKISPLVRKAMTPGARLPVMQRSVKGVRGGAQGIEIKIRGAEIQPIFEFAQQVAEVMEGDPGITNVSVSMDMTKPEYQVHIDRERASALGVTVSGVASALRTFVSGSVSTEYREGGEYYPIRMVVPEHAMRSKEDLEELVVDVREGRPVFLRDVADVRRGAGPVEIAREDQMNQVIVSADAAAGMSVGEALGRAERLVTAVTPPAGVSFAMGGQATLMAENAGTMRTIFLFAALFAYVVLAIRFSSYVLPILVMLSIPFALTGAFGALLLFNEPVGVTVMIGLVIMMGGIASQGVVLLSLAEEMRSGGLAPAEAIRRAAPQRLRPILMTQLTTALGLLPLAMNLGEGGDMLKPMAIAVIGGLLYSLLLTLFFLPIAYESAMRERRAATSVPTFGR